MRLGLISVKHNGLFDFKAERAGFCYDRREIYRLQKEMLSQEIGLMEAALKEGCDVLVTPECGNYCGAPAWYSGKYIELYSWKRQEALLRRVGELAVKYKSFIFFAMVLRCRSTDGKEDYLTNSCVIFDPQGVITDIYDKLQLAGDEKGTYRAGDKFVIAKTPYGNIGVCICWDMQFPEIARLYALKGARLIVCPTWGWEEIYGHARAYENGVFVASAMAVPAWGEIGNEADLPERTPSEVISPLGKVLVRGDRKEPGYRIVGLDLSEADEHRAFRLAQRRPELHFVTENYLEPSK